MIFQNEYVFTKYIHLINLFDIITPNDFVVNLMIAEIKREGILNVYDKKISRKFWKNPHDKLVDIFLENKKNIIFLLQNYDCNIKFNTNDRIVDIIEELLLNNQHIEYFYYNLNPRMVGFFPKYNTIKNLDFFNMCSHIKVICSNPFAIDYIEEALLNPNPLNIQWTDTEYKTLNLKDVNCYYILSIFKGLIYNSNDKSILLLEKYKHILKYLLHGDDEILPRLLKNPALIENPYYTK